MYNYSLMMMCEEIEREKGKAIMVLYYRVKEGNIISMETRVHYFFGSKCIKLQNCGIKTKQPQMHLSQKRDSCAVAW